MKYYPHHIGDFDRATRHLSRIERSIYRDLIDLYYDTEEPITTDRAALCRKIIARSEEESTAVEQVLNEFFTETPTGWYHSRCEEEIAAYRNNTSQKAKAGKASAESRRIKSQQSLTERSTHVEHVLDCRSTNHKPLTINQEPIEKNKDTAASDGVNVCAIPDKRTRSKPPAVPLDYSAWPEQPSESVLTDWIAARKAKKLPVNQTVITRLGNELTRAVSAGLRVDDCLAEAVTRGWQGFKSEWMTNNRGDQHENRRSNSNGFNAIDPNDDSWLTDDAIAYIESGREIGNRVRAGKPLLRRDDDGVYRLATGDDG